MTETAHILVVDDDPKYLSYVSQGLAHAGFTCSTASGVDEASKLVEEGSFDLILLDVMMPGRPGWDLLRELRASDLSIPVIFITARSEVDERVMGLELGADDYIIKPFAFQELIARITAVLRRREAVPSVSVEGLHLDIASHRARRRGQWIELSPREFELLLQLTKRHGEVLTRKELLERVWGIEFDPGTNVVDVQIGRLRRKLDAHGPPLIETVTGVGYRLHEDRESPEG